MGEQEGINKHWARQLIFWDYIPEQLGSFVCGFGKLGEEVSWASRHQEINGKMKGTFMPDTEPSLMFFFEMRGETRSEKDSTKWWDWFLQ